MPTMDYWQKRYNGLGITLLVSLICKSQHQSGAWISPAVFFLTHFTYDLFLLIPQHLVTTVNFGWLQSKWVWIYSLRTRASWQMREPGRSAHDREACASKPNHRFQRFTRNRSTVYYTISGRELHRREIYFRHQTVLSSFSPGLSKAMLGLRLGGLVKNWKIVGFEVKCYLRPTRAFLEKVKTSKES